MARPVSWKGKRVLILGLGQFPQGSGMAAAQFAVRAGADVRVTDQKTVKQLAENVATLKKMSSRVVFHLGRHDPKDIAWADIVVRHQRVRRTLPELVLARELGKEIVSAEGLFFRYCPAPIIGITGTRGKSTTTTLVVDMLRASGKRVWLGGNILISPLTFLSRVKPSDIVVLELSSFQTETLGEESLSPQIACVTNIYQDHLNAYENMEEYAEAKAQIFRHQTRDGLVVLNADNPWTRTWMSEAPGRVMGFSEKRSADIRVTKTEILVKGKSFVKRSDLHVFGDHQAMNVSAAIGIAMSAGATSKGIKEAIRAFRGIPHRQEVVATIDGVTYVDDTSATMPDGTYAAIHALKPRFKKLYLILGGQDKRLNFFGFGNVLRRKVAHVALLPGDASDLMEKELQSAHIPYTRVPTMIDAVQVLRSMAHSGDAIVLSPAATSFAQYANEFERGEDFRRLASGKK